MPPITQHEVTLARARQIDSLCNQFETQWLSSKPSRLEEILETAPEELRPELFHALLSVELELLSREGKPFSESEYRTRFSQNAATVAAVFAELAARRAGADTSVAGKASGETGINPGASQPVAATPHSPIPASIGRYEILQVLGQGAFGTVYRARDPHLDREVALKMPRAGVINGDQDAERFLQEARAAATIHHPNICPVFEVGSEQGNYFLVMGLVPGSSLADHLARRTEPMPQKQAALMVRKLALALDAAHAKGVIHRDLKPSNIMLDLERREPVITDFGMARRLKSDDTRLTQIGVIMGTPAYMSPEQASGGSREVGPASDIFALGVILYELLAGRRPFTGSATEVLGQILYSSIEPPSTHRRGLNPQLEAICLKAMARDTKDRYASMKGLAADLTKALRATSHPEQIATENSPIEAKEQGDEQDERGLSELFEALQAQQNVQAGRFRRLGLLVAAGLAAVVLLLGSIIFFARTPTATVLINIDVRLDDPELHFFLDKNEILAESLKTPIELSVGEHRLIVKRGEKTEREYVFIVSKDAGPTIALKDQSPPAELKQPPRTRLQAGVWHPLIRSAAELTDGKRIFPQTDGSSVNFRDGVLEMKGSVDFRPDLLRSLGLTHPSDPPYSSEVVARDFILRAHVQKLAGLNLFLRVRHNSVRNFSGYGLYFNGSKNLKAAVGLGRYPNHSWKADKGTTVELFEENECDLALAAYGQRITAYVNGVVVLEMEEADVAEGAPVIAIRGDGHSLFRNLEVYVLDGTGKEPDDVMRASYKWRPRPADVARKAAAQVIASIEQLGGIITRDQQASGKPVTRISFYEARTKADDALLAMLHHLPTLEGLNLWGCPITNDGLLPLQKLPKLRTLDLGLTRISGKGVEIIKLLKSLDSLNLSYTQITGEDLRHLAAMKQLKYLALDSVPIRDEDVRHLAELTEMNYLNLLSTKLEGPGLRHLAGMKKLEQLALAGSQVNDAALPHLEGLKHLRQLLLGKTRATRAGVERLHTALPQCQIDSDHGSFAPNKEKP